MRDVSAEEARKVGLSHMDDAVDIPAGVFDEESRLEAIDSLKHSVSRRIFTAAQAGQLGVTCDFPGDWSPLGALWPIVKWLEIDNGFEVSCMQFGCPVKPFLHLTISWVGEDARLEESA